MIGCLQISVNARCPRSVPLAMAVSALLVLGRTPCARRPNVSISLALAVSDQMLSVTSS